MLLGLLGSACRYAVKSARPDRCSNLYEWTRFPRSFALATMSNSVKIGTHNGSFHCDEALACFLLKLLPRYKDAEVVRSRDLSVLATCDIVVDVGRVYDHSIHRYDHHMRDFKESISTVINKPGYDCTIKLSSAGLIYCHFGHEIIKHVAPEGLTDGELELIFKRIYDVFIKEIDAIDNGIAICEGEQLYRIRTDLSSRVDRLNPAWNSADKNYNEQFKKAIELTGGDFLYFLQECVNVWLPARRIVKECIEKRYEIDPSGEIIELPHFVPWIEHLFLLEKELNITPSIKYAIFPDDVYRIRAVPLSPGNFVLRVPLPDAWAGLQAEALDKACGIEGAEFVHSSQFIGGHKTKEGALAMARKSLEMGKAGS